MNPSVRDDFNQLPWYFYGAAVVLWWRFLALVIPAWRKGAGTVRTSGRIVNWEKQPWKIGGQVIFYWHPVVEFEADNGLAYRCSGGWGYYKVPHGQRGRPAPVRYKRYDPNQAIVDTFVSRWAWVSFWGFLALAATVACVWIDRS